LIIKVIKYSLFDSWDWNYFKSISTGDIFMAAMTEETFAKSECYKINRKYFLPKKDLVVRLGCSLSY